MRLKRWTHYRGKYIMTINGGWVKAHEADELEAINEALQQENKRLRDTLNDIEKRGCKLCGSSELALDVLEA